MLVAALERGRHEKPFALEGPEVAFLAEFNDDRSLYLLSGL